MIIPIFYAATPTGSPSVRARITSELAETVEIGSYHLAATYPGDRSGGDIALIFDQRNERDFCLFLSDRKRSRLLRVTGGRKQMLAVGPGVQSSGGKSSVITIRRQPGLVRVFSGPTLLVRAYLAGEGGGACGPAEGSNVWQPSDLFVQELGPIDLEDDFFAGDDRDEAWEMLKGRFAIRVYWDPKQKRDNRPIGASWFANDGPGEHLAVTGEEFWGDYACEVSVRPAPGSTVGLVFCAQDGQNYGVLSLTTPGDSQGGVAGLAEVIGGETHILGERGGSWPAGQWHRLRVEVTEGSVQGLVNGQVVARSPIAGWQWGRVGLYAKGEGDCRFDDLVVHNIRQLVAEASRQPRGPWLVESGSWKIGKGRLTCRAASNGIAVASVGQWGDSEARVKVLGHRNTESGILLRWSKLGGYGFTARLEGQQLACTIGKITPDGDWLAIGEGKVDDTTGEALLDLEFIAEGIGLCGFVNGRCAVKAWDAEFGLGAAGLMVRSGKARFEGFSVKAPPVGESATVLLADATGRTRPGAEHGEFQRFLGDLWQPVGGQWELTKWNDEKCFRLRGAALRFYAPRPGDVAVSAHILKTDGKPVYLTICSDGQTPESGYSLSVAKDELLLRRNGQVVASASWGGEGDAGRAASVFRDGPYVVGRAGGGLVVFRDDAPLGSGYASVGAEGEALLDNLELSARHALAYRFDRVEPDWIPTSGKWLFHSGMACIPWAYWWSADGRNEAAFAWNRHLAPADLAVSFDVSEYTVGYESGEHKHFPYHDISVILAAEDRHPDAGYRFVIGAEGGRYVRLYRKGKMVEQVDDQRFRISMGSHCNTPRAIEVYLYKHNGTLRLVLNGTEALTYDDANPLGVGIVGIGVAGCRANFRDLFLYRDYTWESPMGVTGFSPL